MAKSTAPSDNILRIAIASDLHAFADVPPGRESPSKLQVPTGVESPAEHPMAGLMDLISTECLRAHLLLSPGDLTYQADPRGLEYAWRTLQEAGEKLGVKLCASTVGNHDLASRGRADIDEARDYLQQLRPHFPFKDRALSDQFWSRNYAIWRDDGVVVVLLNSCPLHTIKNIAEFERGSITEVTLRELKNELKHLPPSDAQILVCHHHPQSHAELKLGETDVMLRGQLLLAALEAHGDWLVIHGHKHHPKVTYSAGGARSPIVFGAGSFSGAFGPSAETVTRNQFYIVEIYRRSPAPGLRGRIRAWNWAYGRGWIPSAGSTTGIPALSGFGCRRHPERLADEIAKVFHGPAPKKWANLCHQVQDLAFLLPSDYELMKKLLESKHSLHIIEDNGQPAEVGTARV